MSRYRHLIRFASGLAVILVLAFLAAPAPAWAQRPVALTGAHFAGLTEIVASANGDLTGVDGGDVVVTKPDGTVVPREKITRVEAGRGTLTVDLAADQFARVTSTGTTIAVRAAGSPRSSRPATWPLIYAARGRNLHHPNGSHPPGSVETFGTYA